MSNMLFNALGNSMPNGNNMTQMIQQFSNFKNSFKGNPEEEVKKLLQSGAMSQEQLNQLQNVAHQIAPQIQNLLK